MKKHVVNLLRIANDDNNLSVLKNFLRLPHIFPIHMMQQSSTGCEFPIIIEPNSLNKRLVRSVFPVPGGPTNITCFDEIRWFL